MNFYLGIRVCLNKMRLGSVFSEGETTMWTIMSECVFV